MLGMKKEREGEREMPKAKAKAKQAPKAPKPRAKLDRYVYLPTDLQRAAVFMDRSDFLRKLQKASMIASTGTSRRRDRHGLAWTRTCRIKSRPSTRKSRV